jgi:putative tryptophan/tyrosine transport system substrate-binding protein
MRRRDLIAGLCGAAAWPLTVRAQQPGMQVIGFLHVGAPDLQQNAIVAAFTKGLGEAGYFEGRNVAIDYRFALNDPAKLRQMAADLVRRRVAVLFAQTNAAAAAAKAATATTPIVFSIGGDPVSMGFVSRLNRPDRNMTGVSLLATETIAKMLELLHQCAPGKTTIAMLANPNNAQAEADIKEAQEAARILGVTLQIYSAGAAADIDGAFANILERGAGALLIEGDGLFANRLTQLVVLTARHGLPAIFQGRFFPEVGGLMSYGTDLNDAARIAGTYVGQILKGETVANLPVQQSTKVQLVVNLATARALGLILPTSILLHADEVIE